MALKATIFKAHLKMADIDRAYYADHTLTLARHPSETDERMMIRLLAFAIHASDCLQFTRGLSTDQEPDLWQKNLQGEIETWIELGQPDIKRLRKASKLAAQVFVYNYGGGAEHWWVKNNKEVAQLRNVQIFKLPGVETQQLASLADRNMHLEITVQDGQLLVSTAGHFINIAPQVLITD